MRLRGGRRGHDSLENAVRNMAPMAASQKPSTGLKLADGPVVSRPLVCRSHATTSSDMQASDPALHRISPADVAGAVFPLVAMMLTARSSVPASSDPMALAMEMPSPASLRMTRDSLLAPHMQPMVNTQSSRHPMLIQLCWKNSPRSCLVVGVEASLRGVLSECMYVMRRNASIAYIENQTAVPR